MTTTSKPHECDESCTCPDHGTPLIYSPATDDHACQDVNCRYGHGGWPSAVDWAAPEPPTAPERGSRR